VLTTLILFVLVYGIVFSAGIYYINRLLKKGPITTPPHVDGEDEGLKRPLSAAHEAGRSAIQPGE